MGPHKKLALSFAAPFIRRMAAAIVVIGIVVPCVVSCGEQAFVVYVGTVTEADPADGTVAYFANEPPEDAPPIAGARISLCVGAPKCNAVSDDAGAWGPTWTSFPPFRSRPVRLTVRADGYEPATYVTTYPTTEDPVFAEQLLNVRLRRLTDAGSAGEAARSQEPAGDR